jgi:hypothetical protein
VASLVGSGLGEEIGVGAAIGVGEATGSTGAEDPVFSGAGCAGCAGCAVDATGAGPAVTVGLAEGEAEGEAEGDALADAVGVGATTGRTPMITAPEVAVAAAGPQFPATSSTEFAFMVNQTETLSEQPVTVTR